jgi:Branched-chain amino acid aminotransferase/4-amino-4-deoxychorismate lyase
VGDEGWDHTGPNVVIEVLPLPLAKRAPLYRDGAQVITTTVRRTAPSMLSPRAKTHNYLNMIMAEKPVKALNPDAWAILLDENGNLAEGWAATSSSCARASCSRRRSATCCRASAGR